MQAFWLTMYEISESTLSQVVVMSTSVLILIIELLNMKMVGALYFKKMINFVTLFGSTLVFLRVMDMIE